jgi:glycosyltransferase involved in cell wall biosynthesis
MKVVFSTYECPGLSGNFRRAIQIAEGLSENDCQVTLVTSATRFQLFPKSYPLGKVTIIESAGWLPFKYRFAGFDPFDLVFRAALCLWLRADAYHSYNPKPVSIFPCWLAARVLKKPWLFDWADLWGPGGIFELKKKYTSWFTRLSALIETKLEKIATAQADFTTCISQKMVEITKARGGQPLYLTVGTAPDLVALDQKIVRKKLGYHLRETIVGFVYTDTPDAELLKRVITDLAPYGIKFLIMGPPLFTSRRPPNILYNAFTSRKHLSLFLSTCDLCIIPFSPLPINQFRYPNKIGDYLACHKPFITNPVGDMTSLIDQHQVGWLTPATAPALSRKILTLSKNPAEIQRKTKSTTTFAHQNSWKKLTQELKRFYLTAATAT